MLAYLACGLCPGPGFRHVAGSMASGAAGPLPLLGLTKPGGQRGEDLGPFPDVEFDLAGDSDLNV